LLLTRGSSDFPQPDWAGESEVEMKVREKPLTDDEVAFLRTTRGQVNRLSPENRRKVIELLEKAGATAEGRRQLLSDLMEVEALGDSLRSKGARKTAWTTLAKKGITVDDVRRNEEMARRLRRKLAEVGEPKRTLSLVDGKSRKI